MAMMSDRQGSVTLGNRSGYSASSTPTQPAPTVTISPAPPPTTSTPVDANRPPPAPEPTGISLRSGDVSIPLAPRTPDPDRPLVLRPPAPPIGGDTVTPPPGGYAASQDKSVVDAGANGSGGGAMMAFVDNAWDSINTITDGVEDKVSEVVGATAAPYVMMGGAFAVALAVFALVRRLRR